MVLPDSIRISRVRTYSGCFYSYIYISNTRLSRSMAVLSRTFFYINVKDVEVLQPRKLRFGLGPFSLVTTQGISIDFYLSGYLDISVRRLAFLYLIYLGIGCRACTAGFPIRKSLGHWVIATSPELIVRCLRPSSETSVKVFVIYSFVTFISHFMSVHILMSKFQKICPQNVDI